MVKNIHTFNDLVEYMKDETINHNLKFYLVPDNYEHECEFKGNEIQLDIYEIMSSGASGKADLEFWLKKIK